MEKWLPLEKPDSTKWKHRGDIKVALTLSTEKDQSLTSQEHKHLLKILFGNELQTSQVMRIKQFSFLNCIKSLKYLQAQPFKWNGTFCKESVSILAQHAVQGKLTGAETALARWLVYAHTHCDLPLDYRYIKHTVLRA